MTARDYLSVVYNEQHKPLTAYPAQLSAYLFNRYGLTREMTLLDVGCGRGEFLQGFSNCGLTVCGIDRTIAAERICNTAELKAVQLEHEKIPYADNTFDVVFSKSVIEHFYYPEKIMQEMYRVLKPGGQIITLTPDWTSIYKIFYEDYTHRTPFTLGSLRDIQLMQGFDEVQVEAFFQLPFLWRYPYLKPIFFCIGKIFPRCLHPLCKTLRFSWELMLLSSGKKPL